MMTTRAATTTWHPITANSPTVGTVMVLMPHGTGSEGNQPQMTTGCCQAIHFRHSMFQWELGAVA